MSDTRTPWAEGIGHITPADGNIFADLGLPDAAELLVKAELVLAIRDAIAARGWTQARAAEHLGVSQPNISLLMRGRLGSFSLDRLIRFVTLLGQDVEIAIRPQPEARPGEVRVRREASHPPAAALIGHRDGD